MKLFRSIIFWFFFLLPFVAGATYYLVFASNQYEALAHFTIEKSGAKQSDPLGALTGLAGSVASTRDALIIKDFIKSHEVIERTSEDFDLKKIYAREDKNWLSRLKAGATVEETVEYWQDNVNVKFDTSSGIISLSVLAFEPKDAVLIVNSILGKSETLVNELSEKARQDTLLFAKEELQQAEKKLKKARADIRIFRDTEQSLSPEKNAESKVNLVETLEAERARVEANLEGLKLSFPEASNKVIEEKNKLLALIQQVKRERVRSTKSIGKNNTKSMSSLISRYEELLTEQGFAEKSYEIALLNIKEARIEATQQSRYLSVIVHPFMPEKPAKPEQPNDLVVLFLSCLLLWGILSLIVSSIKDHAGWV